MTYWDGNRWHSEEPVTAPPHKRPLRRLLGAIAEATLLTMLVFGLIAGTTLAAKGGAGKGGGGNGHGGPKNQMSGTVSLVLVSPPDANYGEGVKFDVVTNAPWPFVDLDCSQGGVAVYHSTVGYYGGWPWSDTFTLGGWAWPSGGADCVATLYNSDDRGVTVLATLPFVVIP